MAIINSQTLSTVHTLNEELCNICCIIVYRSLVFRPNFNNKGNFPRRNFHVNTKLEVRNIPPELNTITKLNEHFSKFGTIVNIQVTS